ncbi:unnamed protein product [Bemisia tabaci]|uniref:UDP-glucuronosyltransferase n=1 Tax=Bemisia tabaci TaxID=7038 RepID=A0A9P0F651_BEMTA|nr:unnamed protein product [Bemisia tabaci]
MSIRYFFYIVILCCGANAFNVLILSPVPSFSHQRPILTLTENLVKKGHRLFVVSPNKASDLEQNANYTFVDLSFLYDFFKDKEEDGHISVQRQISKWNLYSSIFGIGPKIAESHLTSEQFLQFKRRVEQEGIKFDVVMIQSILAPYLVPIARLLAGDAPIVSISSYAMDWLAEDALGSPVHLSFLPSVFGHYTDKMNLWQKLENWFSHTFIVSGVKKNIGTAARRFLTDVYGLNATFVDESPWERIGLTLITSNSLYYYPRLIGPNVVEVGPLHVGAPGKLPTVLQNWLDGAKRGVIYFSLGSNMKSKSLAPDALENFLEFFRGLPAGYRVLWKWESDQKIPGQSDNIFTQKWMPQSSVLAHPKVKLFITQGGLQSFQEAVHFGVPTVTIPWFIDQELMAAKTLDAKIGGRLSPQDIHSFTKIKSTIETVLYDESYMRNMQRLSTLSHDFTSEAVDKAVFWVEHVARHGGASHLRPSIADSSLFQYFCLDIISFLLVLGLSVMFLVYSAFKFLISYSTIKKGKVKHS